MNLAQLRRTITLLLLVGAAASTGCDSPCTTLANRLCQQAGSDQACEHWKDRVSRVSTETCITGNRALDRERLR